MARLGHRDVLWVGSALVTTVALTSCGSTASAVGCASYHGRPATWASFTEVKASGVSCAVADKLIRGLYSPDYSSHHTVIVNVGKKQVVFAIQTHDTNSGFNLRLVGRQSDYRGDTVTSRVAVPPGAPDANGNQT